MPTNKAYNLHLFCKLRDIEKDSSEGKEFLDKKIVEQLIIIKKIREEQKASAAAADTAVVVPPVEDEEFEDFSIINSIFLN